MTIPGFLFYALLIVKGCAAFRAEAGNLIGAVGSPATVGAGTLLESGFAALGAELRIVQSAAAALPYGSMLAELFSDNRFCLGPYVGKLYLGDRSGHGLLSLLCVLSQDKQDNCSQRCRQYHCYHKTQQQAAGASLFLYGRSLLRAGNSAGRRTSNRGGSGGGTGSGRRLYFGVGYGCRIGINLCAVPVIMLLYIRLAYLHEF